MMYYWNGDWGGMFLAMLLNAVVWVALISLLIWAMSRFIIPRTPSAGPIERGPSALDILRQRYARGEIDAATYERMRQQLGADDARDALPASVVR